MTGENIDLTLDLDRESDAPVPMWSARTERELVADAVGISADRTAAAFTPEGMVRPARAAPVGGWRRLLFLLTRGRVTLSPSIAELREQELIRQLKTPIRGCRKVAFISRKGGVGKTTTCLLAGHTFAAYRGDRVIALDGNPDAGTLGHRVRRETTATVTSLLADAIESTGTRTSAPTRRRPRRGSRSSRPTTTRESPRRSARRSSAAAIGLLERHYNLVCLDTGTGVLESATRGILAQADQIVVVSAPSLDGARAASSTLDWLEENGHADLVRGAVAVINAVRSDRGIVDVDRIEQHFAARCRASVRIPWDPHLEAGAETVVDELQPETRAAYLELAAAVAAGFADGTGKRDAG